MPASEIPTLASRGMSGRDRALHQSAEEGQANRPLDSEQSLRSAFRNQRILVQPPIRERVDELRILATDMAQDADHMSMAILNKQFEADLSASGCRTGDIQPGYVGFHRFRVGCLTGSKWS